jgi:hypothetical protein
MDSWVKELNLIFALYLLSQLVKKILQNILIFIVLGIFVFPITVKSIHYHGEVFICKAKTEKHFHKLHDKCSVCNYEFSLFSKNHNNRTFYKDQIIDGYINHYQSSYYFKSAYLAFLLRAPPFFNF